MEPTNSKLYHKEVFWPKGKFSALQGRTLPLRYAMHALRAALNDRYGVIQLPKEFVFDEARAFEMELSGQWVTKFAVRLPYNASHDLVLVVIPDGSEFFVKTVWLNSNSDAHKTLDRSKYAKA